MQLFVFKLWQAVSNCELLFHLCCQKSFQLDMVHVLLDRANIVTIIKCMMFDV